MQQEDEGQAPQHGRIALAATRRRGQAVAAASRTVSMFEGSLLSWSRWLLVLAVRTALDSSPRGSDTIVSLFIYYAS